MTARRFLLAAALAAPTLFIRRAKAESETEVGFALALVVDISASVNLERAQLQRDGYVQALRDPMITDLILDKGGAALGYIEFSDPNASATKVIEPFCFVTTRQSIHAFAGRLAEKPIRSFGNTSISAGVDLAVSELNNICPASSGVPRIIDVSGDGNNNNGRAITAARDDAIAQGIRINGLPIPVGTFQNLDEHPLLTEYRNTVITPAANFDGMSISAGFIVPAYGFEDFSQAVKRKLLLEIAEAPTPQRRNFAGSMGQPLPKGGGAIERASLLGWRQASGLNLA